MCGKQRFVEKKKQNSNLFPFSVWVRFQVWKLLALFVNRKNKIPRDIWQNSKCLFWHFETPSRKYANPNAYLIGPSSRESFWKIHNSRKGLLPSITDRKDNFFGKIQQKTSKSVSDRAKFTMWFYGEINSLLNSKPFSGKVNRKISWE